MTSENDAGGVVLRHTRSLNRILGLVLRVVKIATTWAALFALLVVFLSVLVQIASRWFINAQFLWTDEIAKICFVWSVYLGAILVAAEDSWIRLDIAGAYMPAPVGKCLRAIFAILALGASFIAIPASIRLVETNMTYRLSFTELPYAWLYGAGVVFFVGVALFSARNALRRFAYSNSKQ